MTTSGRLVLTAALLAAGRLAAQGPNPTAQPPRAQISQVSPGPTNTLGHVPRLLVGQYTRFGDGYRTGTTVILTDSAREVAGGMTAGYSQMGGAPGTKE